MNIKDVIRSALQNWQQKPSNQLSAAAASFLKNQYNKNATSSKRSWDMMSRAMDDQNAGIPGASENLKTLAAREAMNAGAGLMMGDIQALPNTSVIAAQAIKNSLNQGKASFNNYISTQAPEAPAKATSFFEKAGRMNAVPTYQPATLRNEVASAVTSTQIPLGEARAVPTSQVPNTMYRATDSHTASAVLGNGMYASNTPNGAAQYGQDVKQLVVKPGTKMLDLRSTIDYDSFIQKAIIDNQDSFVKYSQKLNPSMAVSKVITEAAKKLGYDGIMGEESTIGNVFFNPKKSIK